MSHQHDSAGIVATINKRVTFSQGWFWRKSSLRRATTRKKWILWWSVWFRCFSRRFLCELQKRWTLWYGWMMMDVFCSQDGWLTFVDLVRFIEILSIGSQKFPRARSKIIALWDTDSHRLTEVKIIICSFCYHFHYHFIIICLSFPGKLSFFIILLSFFMVSWKNYHFFIILLSCFIIFYRFLENYHVLIIWFSFFDNFPKNDNQNDK